MNLIPIEALPTLDDVLAFEETRGTLSGVVQQVNAATSTFVLRGRNGTTQTVVVTPDTAFMGVAPGQIQPGRRLVASGTTQPDGVLIALTLLSAKED